MKEYNISVEITSVDQLTHAYRKVIEAYQDFASGTFDVDISLRKIHLGYECINAHFCIKDYDPHHYDDTENFNPSIYL